MHKNYIIYKNFIFLKAIFNIFLWYSVVPLMIMIFHLELTVSAAAGKSDWITDFKGLRVGFWPL